MVIIKSEDKFISSVWSAVYCRYIQTTHRSTLCYNSPHSSAVCITPHMQNNFNFRYYYNLNILLHNGKFYPEIK